MDNVVISKTALDNNVSAELDEQTKQNNFFDVNVGEQFRGYYISKAAVSANYYKGVDDDGVDPESVVRVNLDNISNSNQVTYFDANVGEQFRAYYISKAAASSNYYQVIIVSNPLNITTIDMPNTNTDPVSSWIANKLSLDFTNTDISSTHLLACEFDISGDLTDSILNPYADDLKPFGTEVTSGTDFDSTFDSYITFGAWSKDVTQGYIEPTYILPTNTFDSSVTNSDFHKGNLLTIDGVKHLLWAPPGGTLKPTTNNFPISQIIIADSVNDATFSFVYGKGVLGNNDSNGVPQGQIINGRISAGVMTVTNYE